MPPPSAVRPAPLARRVEIETPEQVMIGFEVAGVGSRALAAIYDVVLVALVWALALIGFAFSRVALDEGWITAMFVLINFAILWGYFALFEAFWGGRTPGKRRVGIRVVMDTGHPITLQAAVVRNLLRIVDYQPGLSGLVGLIFVLLHPQGKRLGDLVAGTIVVRDEVTHLRAVAGRPSAHEAPAAVAPPARLADDEYRLLDQLMARVDDLPRDVRQRFVTELSARFAARFPEWNAVEPRFLPQVHAAERAARRAPGAARLEAGGQRRLRTGDRFVALRQDAWEAFRAQALNLERHGVAHLTGSEILAFATAYRAIAADLARAATYGVDERAVAHLERIVAAGHNALYGMRRERRLSGRRLLLGVLPGAVVRRSRYVVAACLLFALPAVTGYALLRERPAIGQEILPDQVLARAAAGSRQQRQGIGYAETPSPFLPIVASSIIANNVQVAFAAFAFGITAGIGTVLVLVFNGLFFGAVLGHFANASLAGWLLTFVAGHGVLELTAIFVAGGAGLLVARALIAPGDLARRDALVVFGGEAIRMVGAATCLLVLAGTIEGLLSASAAPAAVKFGVSAATALLLGLYLRAGSLFENGEPSEERGVRSGIRSRRGVLGRAH